MFYLKIDESPTKIIQKQFSWYHYRIAFFLQYFASKTVCHSPLEWSPFCERS